MWAIGLTPSCFIHSVCAAGTTRMSGRGGCVERLTRTAGEVEVVGSSPGRVVDRRRRRPRAAGTTTTRAGEPAAAGAIPAGAAGIIPIILIIPAGEADAALARGQAEAADGGTGSAHPTASEHKTDRIRPPFLSRSQDLSAIHSFTQSLDDASRFNKINTRFQRQIRRRRDTCYSYDYSYRLGAIPVLIRHHHSSVRVLTSSLRF